jgi:hypothetical protein
MVRALLQFGQVVRMDESSLEDEAANLSPFVILRAGDWPKNGGRKNRIEMPVAASSK